MDRISAQSSSQRVSLWTCIRFWRAQRQPRCAQTLQNPVSAQWRTREGATPLRHRHYAGGTSAGSPLPYLGKSRQREAVSLGRTRSTTSPRREYRHSAHVLATHLGLTPRCQSPPRHDMLDTCVQFGVAEASRSATRPSSELRAKHEPRAGCARWRRCRVRRRVGSW
jgi:hypothetical protein